MTDGRQRARRRQQWEMLIGVLGFFTVMAFAAAVVPIVTGAPSASASLVLLGCVLALGGALAARRRG